MKIVWATTLFAKYRRPLVLPTINPPKKERNEILPAAGVARPIAGNLDRRFFAPSAVHRHADVQKDTIANQELLLHRVGLALAFDRTFARVASIELAGLLLQVVHHFVHQD